MWYGRRRRATENRRNQNIVAQNVESCHGKPGEQWKMWHGRRRRATENRRNQNIVAQDVESCHGKPEEQLEMWYNNYVCVKVEGRLQIEYWLQLL